jgi:hypothetical protein
MAKLNERFITALKQENKLMKEDIQNGKAWKYCNNTRLKANSFENARKKDKRRINCVDGVQWALKTAGVPGSALAWYGARGGLIQWCGIHAEANCRKYFDLIKVGNKTVLQLYNAGVLCEGDILTYVTMNHTNAYIGSGKSFDSGHEYADGSGEGAVFRKWIGDLAHKDRLVGYILRLKDRTHYRVQAGAYADVKRANAQVGKLETAGFKGLIREEDGMYKVQAGIFNGRENAEALVANLEKRKINAFIREE